MVAGVFPLRYDRALCDVRRGIGFGAYRTHLFWAHDPKAGACGSILNIAQHNKLNHFIAVEGGIVEKECGELVRAFFGKKRSGSS